MFKCKFCLDSILETGVSSLGMQKHKLNQMLRDKNTELSNRVLTEQQESSYIHGLIRFLRKHWNKFDFDSLRTTYVHVHVWLKLLALQLYMYMCMLGMFSQNACKNSIQHEDLCKTIVFISIPLSSGWSISSLVFFRSSLRHCEASLVASHVLLKWDAHSTAKWRIFPPSSVL